MASLLRSTRRAFTLVELLIAISIIVLLSSLVLYVVVSMGERDGTTDAAGLTRQWLMIAKNRAARDGAPRGVRLIVGMDPNNIAKLSPFWVTELQYIEAPPIIVTYPAQNGDFTPTGSPTDPAVVFTYPLSPGPPANPNSTGTVIPSKLCQIVNLQASDALQIQPNCILQLPIIGTWHRIVGVASVVQTPPASGRFTVTVNLDSFPDSQMGAAGVMQPQPQPAAGATPPSYLTFLFGITAPPRPLVGEPPLQLPKNICIDLTFTQDSAGNPLPTLAPPPVGSVGPPFFEAPSIPQANPSGIVDYDILFAPNGTVAPVGAGAATDGMIVLWHRDYTKLRALRSPLTVTNIGPGPTFLKTYDMAPFTNGGEQQLVAIRCKTGALGQFPVLWPNGGQYLPPQDPYFFARQSTTAP